MLNPLLVRPDVPTATVRRLQWLGVVMVLASVLAWAMTPTKPWAGRVAAARYESFFPPEFGDWQLAREQASAVVNPQQQETLDAIYDEVVSKVYVQRSTGRRVMVSLAYGNNQSRATQVHKPEVCYPAQGFELMSMRKDQVQTSQPAPLPVMRVVAKMGRRVEPLTYWIRAGDRVVRGAIEQNLARISLGLRGYIPDGLLFRVSEINPDATSSFALQDRFVSDFLAQLPAGTLQAFVGTPQLP
ncbi:MAG: EpsI family protein [Burkholderiales bacterium PBB5]|nr:MAG: EpsI family protein [Burkholderiales bacterium PBB5]